MTLCITTEQRYKPVVAAMHCLVLLLSMGHVGACALRVTLCQRLLEIVITVGGDRVILLDTTHTPSGSPF